MIYSPLVGLSATPNLGWKTILYMLDGLYSIGIDILCSQIKNNIDPDNQNRKGMLIRENADDYLLIQIFV